MSVIISIYHIIGILVGVIAILGGFLKFYTKSIKTELTGGWQKELNSTRSSIEKARQKEVDDLKTALYRETSTDNIKNKVRDFINTEVKLMEQDIKQIKEMSVDMKTLLGTQQETLIAIQMSITELKPRIASLEDRVKKLETSSEK